MKNEQPQQPVPGGTPVERPVRPLVERLRNASHGYDEWRVQDPQDGSYCIAFSWPETMHPERAAREWLTDHKARCPGGLHTDYVVACVRVMPEKDRLLLEAADEIERLGADRDSWAAQASQRAQDALDLVAAERERWHDAVLYELDDNGQARAIIAEATKA